MQHLVVTSCDWKPLAHVDGWKVNARGLKFNGRFGYGLLNAEKMVGNARHWKNVPDKIVCQVQANDR